MSGPARPGPFLPSTRMTLEFVWRGRGRPPGRSRLPPTFETPWERELRRLEDPDLYPELEPLPPESP